MLNPFQRFAYKFKKFIKAIPGAIGRFFKAIGRFFVKLFTGIGKGFKNYGTTFAKGDWATKLSYLIFGVGDLHKGKIYKGILYLRRYSTFFTLFSSAGSTFPSSTPLVRYILTSKRSV